MAPVNQDNGVHYVTDADGSHAVETSGRSERTRELSRSPGRRSRHRQDDAVSDKTPERRDGSRLFSGSRNFRIGARTVSTIEKRNIGCGSRPIFDLRSDGVNADGVNSNETRDAGYGSRPISGSRRVRFDEEMNNSVDRRQKDPGVVRSVNRRCAAIFSSPLMTFRRKNCDKLKEKAAQNNLNVLARPPSDRQKENSSHIPSLTGYVVDDPDDCSRSDERHAKLIETLSVTSKAKDKGRISESETSRNRKRHNMSCPPSCKKSVGTDIAQKRTSVHSSRV